MYQGDRRTAHHLLRRRIFPVVSLLADPQMGRGEVRIHDFVHSSARSRCRAAHDRRIAVVRKFKSYVGLKGADRKLRRLLTDFPFTDLAAADRLVDWTGAPVVEL